MNILDIKMNKVVQTINLHNDEATTIGVNESESTVAVGFKVLFYIIVIIYKIIGWYSQNLQFRQRIRIKRVIFSIFITRK